MKHNNCRKLETQIRESALRRLSELSTTRDAIIELKKKVQKSYEQGKTLSSKILIQELTRLSNL